jgi:hypothetical protein
LVLKVKKIVALFSIVFIITPFSLAKGAIQGTENNVLNSNQDTPSFVVSGNITSISIEKIVDGIGITVIVKNNGDIDLNNITVTIKKINSSLVLLKPHLVSLSNLKANESVEIPIHLFGIGLGKFTGMPEITITVNTVEDVEKEAHVRMKVFGMFTKIITTYFSDEAYNGYTLFSPEYSTKTLLINKKGDIVQTWNSTYIQGLGLLLLENGDLLRSMIPYNNPVFISGGMTGGVELFDWNGSKHWQYNYSNTQHCLHHNIEVLPNGHVLMVGWEYKSATQAIAAGRDPNSLPLGELWPDHIIEVEQTGPSEGTIVWEWHLWDHLIQEYDSTKENYGVVKDHPELLDINYGIEDANKPSADWNHINSIDYNEQYDQILLNARFQHEIWVIDHSTTTQEAAGHVGGRSGKGGDILYRWGNPETYEAGNTSDRRLFGQHDAQWIPAGYPGEGHILVFNNGEGRPEGQYSSVEEFIPPVDENGSYYLAPGSAYGPKELVWNYTSENLFDFYAGYLSSTQRLMNGNTLICDGDHGIFFEVTNEKKMVWKYYNTIPTPLTNQVFKIICYAPDYPGLQYLTP